MCNHSYRIRTHTYYAARLSLPIPPHSQTPHALSYTLCARARALPKEKETEKETDDHNVIMIRP